MPLLSVIVPVYNEAKTIAQVLEKINSVPIDKEIVVVDDSSTDGTGKIMRNMRLNNLKVIHHSTNRGKGAAFLTGLNHASGEYIIIQDADLEYNPSDYMQLFKALESGSSGLILGARFTEGHHGLLVHRLGNRFLTFVLNLLFGSHLNDYATCYKLGRRDLFENLDLKATGFDIDVEIICNALKNKIQIKEIPISYYPRTYGEGKKIRLKDAFWAVFYMVKYRLKG